MRAWRNTSKWVLARELNYFAVHFHNVSLSVCVYCTSDICADVLHLVPSITIARAEEMLKGE